MRWQYVFSFVGMLLFFLGMVMAVPLVFGYFFHDTSVAPLLKSMAITITAGGGLYLLCRGPKTEYISQREGMAIAAIAWTAVGLFAALPFYVGGTFETFIDAFFESISGFTTTGASVMTNIEAVPKGMLLWRSLTQWLGGMGIIVLSIAILPFLGSGGMQLYKAEVPGPTTDRLKPRIRETAKTLWKVYALFTLLEVVLLMLCGMGFYDSLSHAFTTMASGGFSPKNLSIAHYHSISIESVIIVFMIFAGINFSLHYQMLRGKPLAFWRDSECRFFLAVAFLLVCMVSFNIYGPVYDSMAKAFRYGAFQVISIISTTGYSTADFNQWPAMSQLILVICMLMGACTGSTSGAIKSVRIMAVLKYCYREVFNMLHPHAVTNVKIGGKMIADDVVGSMVSYVAIYLGIFGAASVLMAGMGVDFKASFSSVATCMGGVGPGLGSVGPAGNFAGIPAAGKWLLVLCMLLGRLEIYSVIIFLVPEFWRK